MTEIHLLTFVILPRPLRGPGRYTAQAVQRPSGEIERRALQQKGRAENFQGIEIDLRRLLLV